MYNGLSKSLGTVLLAAAVFAAAGCTSPGNPNATSTSANSSSPSASAPESPADPAATSSPSPAGGATPTTIPADPVGPSSDAMAAPVPTFAPSEQSYLASRVPEGTDPNAVLQAAQERCAQLETVKLKDQKAVVSHLIETQDSGEVDAIAELCPGLQPELVAARNGFTDGDFTIGAPAPKAGSGSISAGKYMAWNPSPTCTLAAYNAAGDTVAKSNGTSAVTIPVGAIRVVSDGCFTWLAA